MISSNGSGDFVDIFFTVKLTGVATAELRVAVEYAIMVMAANVSIGNYSVNASSVVVTGMEMCYCEKCLTITYILLLLFICSAQSTCGIVCTVGGRGRMLNILEVLQEV